jgi:glucose-6-phosphate isomerase
LNLNKNGLRYHKTDRNSILEKLQKHFDEMKDASMLTMFEADVSRTEKFNLKWNDFLIDYSKNIIKETIALLLEANEMGLEKAIADYFEV